MRRNGYMFGSRNIELFLKKSGKFLLIVLYFSIFILFPIVVFFYSVPFLYNREESPYSLQLRFENNELYRRIGDQDFNIMGYALHGPADPKLQFAKEPKMNPFWASLFKLPIQEFDHEICLEQKSYFRNGKEISAISGSTLRVFYSNRKLAASDFETIRSSEVTIVEVMGRQCFSKPEDVKKLVTKIGVAPGKLDLVDVYEGINQTGIVEIKGTGIRVNNASPTGTFVSQENMKKLLGVNANDLIADLEEVQVLTEVRQISFIQWFTVFVFINFGWWTIAGKGIESLIWLREKIRIILIKLNFL